MGTIAEEKDYISPSEAARILGYSSSIVIYELYHSMELRGYQRKCGARIFIERSSLLEYRDSLIKGGGAV